MEHHRFKIPLLLISFCFYIFYIRWSSKVPCKFHRKILDYEDKFGVINNYENSLDEKIRKLDAESSNKKKKEKKKDAKSDKNDCRHKDKKSKKENRKEEKKERIHESKSTKSNKKSKRNDDNT